MCIIKNSFYCMKNSSIMAFFLKLLFFVVYI